MTVRKNIAYPLKARKMREALASGAVERTAELVDCQELLERYPAQLSGGQQQRVALARGLVASPDLVLFDEPLSNLDARLRDQVRAELHELHQRTPFTGVFVTHDQSEALALGTRMAIMRAGTIEQLDTPRVVFENPSTEYVAAFIGMSNRIIVHYVDGSWKVGTSGLVGAPLKPLTNASEVAVRVRPDDARLVREGDPLDPQEVGIPAVVADVEFGGSHLDVMLDADTEKRLHVRVDIRRSAYLPQSLGRGDRVVVAFDTDAARFYDADQGSGRPAERTPAEAIA